MVLWTILSLLGAAVFSPWLYMAGKSLAAHANANECSAFVEWLGAACDRAKLGRYFSRSLMLSALVLLPFLIKRVRRIGIEQGHGRIIELNKLGTKQATAQFILSAMIASGILWAFGMILVQAGAFIEDPNPVKSSRLLSKCLAPAIGVSFIEEWLFRGLVLGLWLRTHGPIKATIYSSLLFSFLHFLKPPGGVPDPDSALAGFVLLWKVIAHFAKPEFFVGDFITLTVVGTILCWVTLRTRSLWFAIGLHAGWVFAYAAFNLYYNYAHSPLHPWAVGLNLRSGVVPMFALILTAVLSHFVIRQLMCECRKKKRETGQSASG